jgi:hypothetical protein
VVSRDFGIRIPFSGVYHLGRGWSGRSRRRPLTERYYSDPANNGNQSLDIPERSVSAEAGVNRTFRWESLPERRSSCRTTKVIDWTRERGIDLERGESRRPFDRRGGIEIHGADDARRNVSAGYTRMRQNVANRGGAESKYALRILTPRSRFVRRDLFPPDVLLHCAAFLNMCRRGNAFTAGDTVLRESSA